MWPRGSRRWWRHFVTGHDRGARRYGYASGVATRGAVSVVIAVLALVFAPPAFARDPGRWLMTGVSSVPLSYWQGVTSDPARNLYFDGVFAGLYRTTSRLRQTAGSSNVIAMTPEGYNHIGDVTQHRGRILLPLECFEPGVGNTCGRGAIGVADPRTLAWRYYVNLDPAEIPKAMWAETSPDGRLLWTSSGDDLLAYRLSEISSANAAPAPPIRAARRLAGAVPPSGITGAAFLRRRLLLAGQDAGLLQLYSVGLNSGRRRLEIERDLAGESEGLMVFRTLGGDLHWLVAIADPEGRPPTYGPENALLHFVPRRGRRGLRVRVLARSAVAGPRVRLSVRVTRRGRAVRRARVNFAGRRARTNRRGRAKLVLRFNRPGRYRVLARKRARWGLSRWVRVTLPMASGARPRGLAAARRFGGR
jgi:hypothetical protein